MDGNQVELFFYFEAVLMTAWTVLSKSFFLLKMKHICKLTLE